MKVPLLGSAGGEEAGGNGLLGLSNRQMA